MLLKIGRYEVEVTAYDTEMKQEDTRFFLNHIGSMAFDAMHWNNQEGYGAIADLNRESAMDICAALRATGLYDKEA